MEDYLRVVIPHIDPELVSSEALSRIQALAQILPPFSIAGFECRLGEKQSRVDFQVSFPHLNLNLPENFLTHSFWQTFQDFCQEWVDPTSLLHRNVDRLWLEFDLPDRSSQVPIPCFFLSLNKDNIREFQYFIKTILRLLNYRTDSILESNLLLCANCLPNKARIAHIGAMLSRPTQEIRIVVKEIPSQELCNFLDKIGWIDTTNKFKSLVAILSEFVDSIALTFDVGDTIHPRIGLECFLEKQPYDEPRWQTFLDYLVEEGLCTPAKRKALLAWPGFSQKADIPELWPTNLAGGDLFLGSNVLSVFWRTINHIKVIYEPGNLLEAKGYLAFGHNWLNASDLSVGTLLKTEDSNQANLFHTSDTEVEVSQYLKQVCSYYDSITPLYLKYIGKTYQAGVFPTNLEIDFYRHSNLYFGAQAGIQPGHHILDAGCGVCGPSIDIARNIKGITIDAITLSSIQADTARELVQEAGLADRIQVHVGDFHQLPFTDEVFDVVFFLESTGYSYNFQRLFAEVYRVLRSGGYLYIKDVFCKEPPLSKQEQQELAEFDRVYAQYKTSPMSEIVKAISSVNFQEIISCELKEINNTKLFSKAMFEYKNGLPELTEFGKSHYRQFKCLPVFFGEIKARKPST
ncbi:MAG TPA: class I SAM-dependent methyltransferase [Leptolyngbyaceae cyanobacterium]